MRIAIINMTAGGLSMGYKKYLKSILPLMAKDHDVLGIDVFLPYGNYDFQFKDKINIHFMPAYNELGQYAWLKKELTKIRPDLIFIPTARWINCDNKPVISMIRNMEPILMPFRKNPLKESFKNIGRFIMAMVACRKANKVIAVSEFVKSYLVKKRFAKEHKIAVIYHGVAPYYEDDIKENGAPNLLLNSSPFLFTAGSIRPARGLEDIIKALAIVSKKQHINIGIAGRVDYSMQSYFKKLKCMIKKLGLTEHVHWLGELNDYEMSWCYTHCKAFVMTSRIEACPNVVLEALAHGCVSISTESPPMSELFQDIAVYYKPNDYHALGKAILETLSWDENKRKQISDRARRRASEFSWDFCVKKTLNLFKQALLQIHKP
jgi:glycosyltransferase involved in cell wall biosynthesis